MKNDKIIIGKYKEIYNDSSMPSVFDNISDISINHKNKILHHLKSGSVVAVSPSYIKDIVSNKTVNQSLVMMSDGKYAWRSDVVYHFEKYNLVLPDEFIKEIID